MTDSPDYRLFLNERFEGLSKLMSAEFINVHEKLSAIEKQTTKTNGRVSDVEVKVEQIEKDILVHPIKCNQAKKIDIIEKTIIDIKGRAKGKILGLRTIRDRRGEWIKVAMFIIGALSLCVIAWNSIRGDEKQDLILKKQDEQGIPFVQNSRGEFIALPDSTVIKWFPNDSITYTIIKNK